MANISYSAGSGAPAVFVRQLLARQLLIKQAWPWSPYVASAAVCYMVLCSYLRFQRRDAMAKWFNYPDRKSLSRMTNVEAQKILSYVGELEFPWMYYTSLQFALFKTYGIPTISGLLVATKQFSSQEFASKRYVDTGVIIGEFSGHHPKSERVLKAIARMNYIHSGYMKSGKISHDDLLYTLSVFITEPVIWVKKYEWREFTDMEVCAVATFWKSIGDAMGIEYAGRLSKTEWVDGLEFFEDIKNWAKSYEEKYMVPAATNKTTADELVPLLLFYVPRILKGFGRNLVGVLMGDMLRTSMSYATPPRYVHGIVSTTFAIRKYFLRYLALPRPEFLRFREIPDAPDKKTGRYNMKSYMSHPFYVAPSFLNRWGPKGWMVWAAGGDVPGNKADKYSPEGYIMSEVGPNGMKGKGLKEMAAWEEKLQVERPGGCPFAFSK